MHRASAGTDGAQPQQLEQLAACDTYTSSDVRAYDSELVLVNDSNSEFFAPFLRVKSSKFRMISEQAYFIDRIFFRNWSLLKN